MKTRLLIIIGIIAISVIGSVSTIAFIDSPEKQTPMKIDPRILQAFDSFAITSNFQIYEIFVDETVQGVTIKVFPEGNDSHLALQDPLKLLQKIYPDYDIIDYVVLINGIEISTEKNNNKLSLHVNNNDEIIQIIGMSKN